jgi:Uri superfamily endonuclease
VPKIINKNSGVYLLEIFANRTFLIYSPRFNGKVFPKGFYYYAGSAQKNLVQRLRRHLAPEKIINWHIDHITSISSNEVKNIFILENVKKHVECEMVRILLNEFKLKFPIINFGNGDCDSCKSHLLYSAERINHNHFISRYQSIARLIPASNFTF